MQFKITEDVLKSLLQYLASRPYSEVAGIISALQKSEKIENTTGENSE